MSLQIELLIKDVASFVADPSLCFRIEIECFKNLDSNLAYSSNLLSHLICFAFQYSLTPWFLLLVFLGICFLNIVIIIIKAVQVPADNLNI